MEQVNEQIVNKLRKILALTTSPAEGEAQAAAYKLEELLTLHNLNIADLEMKGKVKSSVQEEGHDLGKAAFTWKLNLAEGIAKFYYCHPIVDRTNKTVVFIGRKENVESLKMLYGWLIDQIKRISGDERKNHAQLTGEHIDPLRWQVNFGVGAANRLQERLNEKAQKEREANQAVMALVVHHDTEISDYLEKKHGYRTDGKKTEEQKRWDAERAERARAREELKNRDIEAYYKMYPWEKPLTAEEQEQKNKEDEKRNRAWKKKYNRRSRTYRMKTYSAEEIRKMEQGRRSKDAGYKAGNKINMEPFVEDKNVKRAAVC
jgi:hypothetical protein